MTNEAMIESIRNGNTELIEDLWKQNKGIIAQEARRYYDRIGEVRRVDLEDLEQSAYFGLLDAVKDYKPESGFKFTTFLHYHLLNAFGDAAGFRARKQDLIYQAASLDAPMEKEDPDGGTLEEITPGGDAEEDAQEAIYRDEKRQAIREALGDLPEDERRVLMLRYWQGMTSNDIADVMRLNAGKVRGKHDRALNRLRRRKQLRAYREDTCFYRHIGVNGFQRTGESAVEHIVFKWIEKEQNIM